MVDLARVRRKNRASFGPLERYLLDLQGYILFEDALDESIVERLATAIGRQRLPPAGEELASQRFGSGGALFGWDQAFCDLLDHPLALAVVGELIGSYVRIDHAYGIVMSPGTSGLGLHGPAEPFDASQYYMHRMGTSRTGLLTLSWSLSDGSPGLGGFGCIPGSHKANWPLPPGAEALVVEVPQPAGSLLVFSEAVAHQTIPWAGRETRLTLMYKYSPGNSAWDPSPQAAPEVISAMSQRQRLLFQPPSVGGRHPVL